MMQDWRAWWAWVVASALIGAACGNKSGGSETATGGVVDDGGGAPDADSGASGGAGGDGSTASGGTAHGTGGSGATAAGAPGSDGGLAITGRTMTDACIVYALASCGRSAECAGRASPTACVSATQGCPDVVSSAGATRTVDGLLACAEDYETFPCDRLAAGELPACVTPGERPIGEPCLFPSQCASLVCKSASGRCGQCATRGAEGDDCSAADTGCALNLYCDETTLQCTARLGSSAVAPVNLKGPGETCKGSDCVTDYRCDMSSNTGQGTCVAYPRVGQSCSAERSCSSDSYCELDGLVCKARPGQAQPCGVDGSTGRASWCAEGLVCRPGASAEEGTCMLPPAAGDTCVFGTDRDAVLLMCSAGAWCDTTVTPSVCKPPVGPGDPCEAPSLCEQPLSCACADDACATHWCAALRVGGERCDQAATTCHPGYSCVAGACKALDSQGLFDAACGGA